MAELGDPQATGRGLRQAHLARRRCAIAALVSMIYPVSLMLSPLIESAFPETVSGVIWYLTALPPSVYVLSSLRMLLPLDSRRLKVPLSLAIGSLIVSDSAQIASLLLFNRYAYENALNGSLWVSVSVVESVINLLALGGEMVIGLGVALLGARLVRSQARLFGLLGPLSYLLVVVGFNLMAFDMLIFLRQNLLALIFDITGIFFLLIAFALAAFLFFKAAYRGLSHPAQAA
jgi:hypothetical protein